MLLCFKTKLEFKKAPSTSHSAAHPGFWHEASGYSVQKGSVSKAAYAELSKQLSLVPIGAWLLNLHTFLKMFPLSLISILYESTLELKPSRQKF